MGNVIVCQKEVFTRFLINLPMGQSSGLEKALCLAVGQNQPQTVAWEQDGFVMVRLANDFARNNLTDAMFDFSRGELTARLGK